MLEVRITGGEQLDALARRLNEAGGGALQRELLARIRKAAKPLPEAARSSAVSTLPQHGGLAARVAASNMSVRTRLTGSQVEVRFEARSAYNLARMDAGTVRHPVYGNAKVWVSQDVPEGWFSRPAEESEPEIRDAIQRAMRDVADKITNH